jgi:predicted RNase H-like HicB family nuclease
MITYATTSIKTVNIIQRPLNRTHSQKWRYFSAGAFSYQSSDYAHPLRQWDVRYWQDLVGTVETFFKYPIHIITGQSAYAKVGGQHMLSLKEYIDLALTRAKFETIEDEEPFFAEIPGLAGVWATGRTQDECRKNLHEVIEDWIEVRQRRGLQIPSLDSYKLAD